jgi:uncharacterized protein DUF2334
VVSFLRDYISRSGSEIALHGYTHRTNRKSEPTRREYFEFRYLGAHKQADWIRRGTEMVERALGVRPATFVPPWNRLDDDTLTACAENGYRIVSAGAFTRVRQGLVSLGTDCDLETLPARLRAVAGSDDRVFLRVLYHSSTMRASADLEVLEQALRSVGETTDAEVLTLAEAVRQYPDDVRIANEAARNVVPQDEVEGTVRARAVVYRRVFRRVKVRSALDCAYDATCSLYEQGRYRDVCALSPRIDQECRRVVRIGRLGAVAIGAVLAAAEGMAGFVFGSVPPITGYAGAVVVVALSGIVGTWWATAVDTKREIRAASGSALVGALSAAALAEMARLLGSE